MGLLNIDKLVNDYIDKIFDHIAKVEKVDRENIELIMRHDGRNGEGSSKYFQIKQNGMIIKEAYIPDKVIKKILLKPKF